MAELYRFFASAQGDERQYNQADWAEVIAGLSGDGVITGVDDKLEVVATDPPSLSVIVKTGAAWIRGYWYRNTTNKEIQLQAPDPNYPRIDLIVLRADFFVQRKIEAVRKTGVPAVEPQEPSLEQTSDYYEIPLASIYVPASATSIPQNMITDKRELVAQVRRIFISSQEPSASYGMDGDIWLQIQE